MELEYGLNIQPVDETDLEPETYVLTYFIHELNDCLSLWVGDAENLYWIKQESAPDAPVINDIKAMEESDGLEVWENRAHMIVFYW